MEKLRITVNGRSYDVTVEVLETDESRTNPKRDLGGPVVQPLTAINGGRAQAGTARGSTGGGPGGSFKSNSGESAGNSTGKMVKSPMPGTILDINVKSGDQVKRGQVLIILEAMKMENELMAEDDGVIREINVSRGQSVQAGEMLLTLA
ncbi:MAG: Glutaconyl-CoA decarboxylase subunit gamma [Firmicutes bacterium ADurb.Bin456]|nr:MAG: Glutaconyl-CoA decarboxylase subunit gamma [Firmicutes bacterium ADurb.Bin456]